MNDATTPAAPAPAGGIGYVAAPRERNRHEEYAQLKRLVVEKGLMKKQPGYYAWKIFLTLAMLGASLALMVALGDSWLQLLNAAFLAFVFVQIGFMGHDAGHLQISRLPRRNDSILLAVNLLIGLDRSWWVEKHNRHHGNPNHVQRDLDINLPLLAFTEDQALEKRGFYAFIVRYQAFFFLPLLLVEAISIRLDSIQYLVRGGRVKYPVLESVLLAAHFPVYTALVFLLMSPWHAAMFVLVHQGLFGVYMGLVFAPNHKGMVMLDSDTEMDLLRTQVLTARNIRPHPVTDFVYGGLNYQIEHHLFPLVSRNKLGEVRKVVKVFCRDHSVPYHETSLVGANWETMRFLHRVSAPLRRPQRKLVAPRAKDPAQWPRYRARARR